MGTLQPKLPKRKHPRMKFFDYSSNGNYFVTICTDKRKQILSSIIDDTVVLTTYGEIVRNELLNLEKRYSFLKIDKYVIMPNHIHVLLQFQHDENNDSAAASHRPTLSDLICELKSKTVIKINKQYTYGKVFQTSFYEHVINNNEDWSNIWDYIDNNPRTWQTDELYN